MTLQPTKSAKRSGSCAARAAGGRALNLFTANRITTKEQKVRTTEQIAKSVATPKGGRFATLHGLRHANGTGAPSHARLVLTACTALAAALLALLGGALTAAPALALPEGRHYEMVSPPYKGGYGVINLLATAMQGPGEGEGVVFDSDGHFAGQPIGAITGSYLASRGASGWSTSPLLPPEKLASSSQINDISPTLQGLYYGASGPNGFAGEEEGGQNFLWHDLLAPDTEADFLTAKGEPGFGVPLEQVNGEPYSTLPGDTGSDAGFCDVVFGQDGGGEALLSEGEGQTSRALYDLATGAPGCGGERVLRLVAVANRLGSHHEPALIEPSCEPHLGAGINSVAAGGSEIFFQTPVDGHACESYERPDKGLFVRVGGERTLEVSRPLEASKPFGGCEGEVGGVADGVVGEVPCVGANTRAGAQFQGASEDGSRVFFTTAAPLLAEDKDSSNDLYMAEIGCPVVERECEPSRREVTSLVQVSHDPNLGEAAEVQGVSVLSADAQRIYFVARGVLSGGNAEGESPVKGADNLYVYDLGEGGAPGEATMHFVADLCSSAERSGEAADARCPNDLSETGRNDDSAWSYVEATREVQTTGDGGFLVFTSYGQLVAGDTDSARDVYRYDAQSETLDRVSVGEDGYDANGNNDAFNASLPTLEFGQVLKNYQLGKRAISEDGSRVVFETAEPLSPEATNGLTNAYEWHLQPGWSEGRVGLVSSGSDEFSVGLSLGGGTSGNGNPTVGNVAITPSGRDIFFMTTQGLLPQDTDGAEDVYDARLGSGFPVEAAKPKACEGDACQGPLTNPAPLLVPGSVSQAPGENFPPPAAPVVASKKKATVVKCSKGRRLSHGKCVKAKAKKKRAAAKKSDRRAS